MSSSPDWPLTRRSLLHGTLAACAFSVWPQSRSQSMTTEQPGKPLEIWDAHGHMTGLPGTPEERIDQILAHADRMGVEKLMICMGLRFLPDPKPEEFFRDNDAVLKAVAHGKGRVLGFVYLSPKHVLASLKELDRCVKNGPMVGVKLWIAQKCDHENANAIVHQAQKLGVPILQHTYRRTQKNLEGESSPSNLSVLAHRHPEATFIAAHSGNDWEQGIRALRRNENVYCEICGSDPTAGMVEMAVREVGADRVLYGSDMAGRSFASQIAKVKGANISEEDKRKILSGNLKKILRPVLKAKGMV